jgi:hypothetical protein
MFISLPLVYGFSGVVAVQHAPQLLQLGGGQLAEDAPAGLVHAFRRLCVYNRHPWHRTAGAHGALLSGTWDISDDARRA